MYALFRLPSSSMYWSLIFSFYFIDCGCVLGTHLFVATRSVHDIYHWQELPQVSFLSRQTCVCHDKRCVLCLSRQPRREFGDVSCHPPVWNLRAVIRFPFPISSLGFFLCLVLLLFLSCNVSANGPFSFLYPPRKLKYFPFCMAFVWLLYGFRMAFVWLLYGFRMAFVWLLYGFCMAFVWLLYGFCMAFVWLLYGFRMAFVWLLYGFCMALVELPGNDSW